MYHRSKREKAVTKLNNIPKPDASNGEIENAVAQLGRTVQNSMPSSGSAFDGARKTEVSMCQHHYSSTC